MIKRSLILVVLLASFSSSEKLKTVYSPFTSKLDYITQLTSSTIGDAADLSANECVQTDANGAIKSSGGACGGGGMTPGNTDYIQVRSTLQSGSTFYVSSGTVDGNFYTGQYVNGRTVIMRSGSTSAEQTILELNDGSTTSGTKFSLAFTEGSSSFPMAKLQAHDATSGGTNTGGTLRVYTSPDGSSYLSVAPLTIASKLTASGSLFSTGSLGINQETPTALVDIKQTAHGFTSNYPLLKLAPDSLNTFSPLIVLGASGSNAFRVNRTSTSIEGVGGLVVTASATVTGAAGASVTYGVTAGSFTTTDDPYAAGWDGSSQVPTKNAVYDKIETLAGGGGGASALAVNWDAVKITSPTASLNFISPLVVTSVGSGTTAQISLDASSVTLQGQNLIKLQSTLQSAATFYVSSGTAVQMNVGTLKFADGTSQSTFGILNSASLQTGTALISGLFSTNDAYYLDQFDRWLWDGGAAGTQSTFVGNVSPSGVVISGATSDTCVGYASCNTLTTGDRNTNMGWRSGNNITTGNDNSCYGSQACEELDDGEQNAVFGSVAGNAMTSARQNSIFGYTAGDHLTTGEDNALFGYNTGELMTNANNNSCFGAGACNDVTVGVSNVCLGGSDGTTQACQSIVSGSSNTAVGSGAGGALSQNGANSGMVFLGWQAQVNGAITDKLINAGAIGYKATVSSSNTLRLGGTLTNALTVDMSTMTVSSGTISTLYVSDLTASRPTLTDGNKKLVSGQIDFANTNHVTGVQAAAQEPAHTGDVTNSAASLAMTAASTQANIRTFTGSITMTSSNTVTGAGGVLTTFGVQGSSLVAVSSYVQLFSRTIAQIAAITPTVVGQEYYCNNCSNTATCISTGTTIGGFGRGSSRTTACN